MLRPYKKISAVVRFAFCAAIDSKSLAQIDDDSAAHAAFKDLIDLAV